MIVALSYSENSKNASHERNKESKIIYCNGVTSVASTLIPPADFQTFGEGLILCHTVNLDAAASLMTGRIMANFTRCY